MDETRPSVRIDSLETSDGLSTILGFVVVDRGRAFITTRDVLNPDLRARVIARLTRYANDNFDLGVHMLNDEDMRIESDDEYFENRW